jgi:hypothetical protein
MCFIPPTSTISTAVLQVKTRVCVGIEKPGHVQLDDTIDDIIYVLVEQGFCVQKRVDTKPEPFQLMLAHVIYV